MTSASTSLAARARRACFVLIALATAAWSSPLFACPVCTDANDKNRAAFAWSTLFLSLLPLCMIGGIVWFVRRRVQIARAEDGLGA